jgi:hypothetical protein
MIEERRDSEELLCQVGLLGEDVMHLLEQLVLFLLPDCLEAVLL